MTLPDGTLHPTEREMVDELGSNDAATSQAVSVAAWEAILQEGGELVEVKPSQNEWSASEVLAHLTAVELTNALRYRAMVVEESPALSNYDLSDWESVLMTPAVDTPALLSLFRALRRDNLAFWEHLDAAGRARVGVHSEFGPETIELRFRLLAGHDRTHLAQAHRAVADARKTRS